METDNTSTFSAKPPPLNSDQLNYLIWRYLQESGYGEAAVKLQRDWRVDAESLPFAKNIRGHALVSLVQKGLRYHHLSLTIDENGRPSKQLNPSMFFFGPESEKPRPELSDDVASQAPSPENSGIVPRKHPRDSIINGLPEPTTQPAPKRSRKTVAGSERNGSSTRKPSGSTAQAATHSAMDVDMTNGHPASTSDARSPSATEPGPDENGIHLNGVKHDDRMEVDEDPLDGDGHAIEASAAELVPSPIHTLSNGASIGIQVAPAKVANLSPSTVVLDTQDPLAMGPPRQVTEVSWRPGHTNVITAMGDNFCGTWKPTDRSTKPESRTPFQSLVESADAELISALAWNTEGEVLALATYSSQSGQLHLFDGQELTLLEALPASQRAITSLQWHGRGTRLLGIAPYDNDDGTNTNTMGSSILLWDLSNSPNFSGPLSISVPEILVDMDAASYNGNGIVGAVGQQSVYLCRANSELEIAERWVSDPNENDQWTFIRCAWQDREAILVTASAETRCLWMPSKSVTKKDAHDAPITGLELRPRINSSITPGWKQEFATSSMDGTAKIWTYDPDSPSILCLNKLTIGHASPLMTLSFSPDGFCLAGASYDTIRIWNAEHGYNYMATWKGELGSWNGSQLRDDDIMSIGGVSSMNGDVLQTSADHALTWDSESKKLAFGLGSQVAVIDFQR
ncbi:hypothetical protein LTR84_002061 [Exophiala bonariae]|uniref:Anaphase-promoting complex subunit 4-like WD40 domain-containing protein n=1 Tax=Exophiala bonariae TaxID=1690606 RepID=A0AAV9NE64_9EURO|nr:hypothetical protein LTR84_002061 [Exophiala bonariae]